MTSSQSSTVAVRSLRAHKPLLTAISILIVAQLGISLYLPALPGIASFYGTRESAVAATLYAYLIPYGVAQILFAVFYIKLGFRRSISIGFTLFCSGTLAVMFSPDLYFFTLSRIIQGFGGGILSVMVRILIKDQYQGDELNIAFSYLEMFAAITPAFAPFLGALFIQDYSWKLLFVLMLAIGSCVFFSVYYLNVKLTAATALSPSKAFKDYALILKDKRYVLGLLARLLIYASVLIYLSGAPFLFIKGFGLSPEVYGYLMILAAGGTFLGSSLSARRAACRSVRPGQRISFLGAASMLVAYLVATRFNTLSLSLSVISIVLISVSYGLLFPNITATIVKLKLGDSGADVALAGAVQLIGASLINFAATQIHCDWQLTMGALFSFVAVALLVILKEPKAGEPV